MTTPELAARLKGVSKAPARSLDPTGTQRPALESPPPQGADEVVPVQKVSKNLSASLPPRTALLRVIMTRLDDGSDVFKLEGSFEKVPWASNQKDLEHQRRPEKMLFRDLNPTLDSAVKCYVRLLNWSIGKNTLKEWIDTLREAMGNEVLRLIIWDDTDFGIPWELFRLDSTGGEKTEWLGVAVQVIRWTTLHDPNRSDYFSAVEAQCSEGGILCYENEDLVAKQPAYSLRAQPYPGLAPKDDMQALLADLADASKRYGLVYVLAHGDHGDSLDTATLAGVSLGDFEMHGMPALRESGAVVFLNACNSATVVYDADRHNRNFAEVFLRKHASAVIATLAEVPFNSSWRLATALLGRAHDERVNVPEFLRRRRARYFKEVQFLVHAKSVPLSTQQLTDAQKTAIQAFMYTSVFTYFGHPDSVLQLGA
jgi:hypothetical protein